MKIPSQNKGVLRNDSKLEVMKNQLVLQQFSSSESVIRTHQLEPSRPEVCHWHVHEGIGGHRWVQIHCPNSGFVSAWWQVQ